MGAKAMEGDSGRAGGKKSGPVVRLAAGGVVVVALFVLARMFNVQTVFRDLLAWVDGSGLVGGLVFIAIYILATVLFVPGSILTLGAGFVFGVLWGTVYVSIASTVGATAAFMIASTCMS